jgi:hypothetical protein
MIISTAGCGNYRIYSGSVQYDASKYNNIIKSSELNAYLSKRDTLRFILRTPAGFEDMGPEEKSQWNTILSQVEKELIRKGHIVKDRVLLETLLNNGVLTGKTYLSALETDMIIEIMNVEFDVPNPTYEFSINEKRILSNFNDWDDLEFIDCRMALMECRITLVDRGNIGGLFRFYVSGCDEANDFYIKVFENQDGTLDLEHDAFVGWNVNRVDYKSLTHSYDLNDASRNKAIDRLITVLLDTLFPEKQAKE